MRIIKKITAKETYFIRQEVLRKGKPIESCVFDGDDLDTTYHFGFFDQNKLVGILSLFKNNHLDFVEENQYQIRGMAILENYRKQDFGKLLINAAEKQCRTLATDLIWFNARISACGFYEKMGFQKTGTPFDIPNVGEHLLMFKNL